MLSMNMAGGKARLAYTSDIGGEFDIWLYDPRTGASIRLTRGLADNFSVPVWSHDNGKIAFIGRNRIIFVVDVRTGAGAQIDQLEESPPPGVDWSADNRTLAYVKQGSVILYDTVSHRAQALPQLGASSVQWFPGGMELLYEAPDESGISQLFRIRADGTGRRQVTRNTEGPLHEVELSPDGTHALYTTPGASISLIYTVDMATGQTFPVPGGPQAKNYFPQWSPGSNRIAYSATDFMEGRGYFSQIRIAGRRGENDGAWAESDCFATPVSWTPDAKRLTYLSGCRGTGFANEIWMIDLMNPVPVLIHRGGRIVALQWSRRAGGFPPGPAPAPAPKGAYINSQYDVSFHYPPRWQRVTEERYEGPDGFFQIGAISSGPDIGEVCRNEAFHQLQPYGSQPRINPAQIQQQEACLILPSADQPAEMRRQAALIVRYPVPVVIGDQPYNYFILWADEAHVRRIGATLRFLR